MAYDLRGFSVVRNGTAALTVPVWTITGQIVDATTGAVIQDFSGGINFPQVLGQLTPAQQDECVNLLISRLLERRFGIG